MKSIYNSELHKFVSSYLALKGCEIIEQNENFFVVRQSDATKIAYTYIARIASENSDIKLLAKGSQHLESMFRDCSANASYSEMNAEYSFDSVKSTLQSSECCDLCPFYTICENKNSCCDFCPYNKYCNTVILNADFMSLGEIKKSEPTDVIAFIFLVRISNDYSLSQKIEKYVSVIIDINSKEVIGSVKFDNLQNAIYKEAQKSIDIGTKEYTDLLNLARKEAGNIVKNQLEVFKKEIEDTLNGKIRSIIDKYEEEYADNYTKISLKNLDRLQEEAVRLCEREINGYAINCEYNLNNVLILHTRKDEREMIFKHQKSSDEFKITSEIFLNRVDIRCDECSTEIDTAYLCHNGHVLCKDCADICSACHITVCSVCDDESYICSTCGELVCNDCHTNCRSCQAVVCPSHSYRCMTCGNDFCIDCYNICVVCSGPVCETHTHICEECGDSACIDHIFSCGVCGSKNCGNHIYNCSICEKLLCKDHAFSSAFSGRIVCADHKDSCHECNRDFATDELERCSVCDVSLCPEHALECKFCSAKYCREHIKLCDSCLSHYCSCTKSIECKLCHESFCPDCVDDNGYCKACTRLSYIEKNNILIKEAILKNPELDRFKVYNMGESGNIYVIYGKSLFGGNLYVLNRDFKMISKRKISIFEVIKTKLLR